MNPQTFIEVSLQFFAYAFLGWIWETLLAAFKRHKFVDTGFLVGPITPIYGFAVLSVLYLLRPWQQTWWLLFISATIVVTILEYLTGSLLERLFHTKWWNYEQVPLNIQGRVALPVSIFWGICCVVIVKFVQPQVLRWVDVIGARFGLLLPVVLIAMMSFDLGFTLANLQSFRQRMEKLNLAIEERKGFLVTEADQVKHTLQENWEQRLHDNPKIAAHLSNLSYGQRRLLDSFPNMRVKNVTARVDEIKELVTALKADSKRKK